MRKSILAPAIFASILFLCTTAEAQNPKSQIKPDFSGTWLLDTKKSNTAGLTTSPDLPITILHQDPEFKMVLSSESNGQIKKHEFIYFTDGRGEENEATSVITSDPSGFKPEDLRNKKTESKTKWSGNKIVTRSRYRLNVPGGTFVEFEQVDEWKLSDDGKVLTQTSRVNLQHTNTAFIPSNAPDKKRVFNRQ
ncbi:MAG TPA: hypothetical protein VLA93_13225 [Pyrinomonadaceae bacterium]|nr:hypothetical protein [Pyrinomonadaceae bacterium]